VPEILPFILAGLIDIPLALTVVHILAIDLGTDLLPALALGAENPEPDVLLRQPRKQGDPVIDRSLLRRAFLWLGLIEAVLSFTGFFAVYVVTGALSIDRLLSLDIEKILVDMLAAPSWVQSLAVLSYFSGVLIAQAGNAFACRSETLRGRQLGWLSNPLLLGGISLEIILFIVLALYNSRSQHPVGILFWIGIATYAPILYGLDWLRKQWVGKRSGSRISG